MKRFHIRLLCTLLVVISTTVFAQTTRQDTLKELMRKVDILTRMLEKQQLGEVARREYKPTAGVGPAASHIYYKKGSGVSLAGYGEIVYQNYSATKDDAQSSNKTDQIDYLRNILYVGYKFNNRFLFNAEIEIEHAVAGEDGPGEVAMEFGYIDAILSPTITIRGGMMLIPVGIINELHEPPTFFGVLRPQTARQIIPTTWRSNGIGLLGSTSSGISYRLYLVEGLNAVNYSSRGIRSGRQSGAKAIAEDFALTGRLEYAGIPGLTLGASFFTGNSGQGLTDSTGKEIQANTSLIALHGILRRSGLELRVLYAMSSLSDVTRLNQTMGLTGDASIGKRQRGFYITAAYDVLRLIRPGSEAQLLPYFQYDALDTQDDIPEGFTKNPANRQSLVTIGVLFKPISRIGLKIDYINRDNDAGNAIDQWNVGLSYLF